MHTPYQQLFGHAADFEVTYQLFSSEEGGRKLPAFQGILWGFLYEDFPKEGFMIYPEILDTQTKELFASGIPIPVYGIATVWILNPALRPLHQQRVQVGTRGYFSEAPKKVDVCEVTRLLDLHTNPTQ
jgi:hypothetical protein